MASFCIIGTWPDHPKGWKLRFTMHNGGGPLFQNPNPQNLQSTWTICHTFLNHGPRYSIGLVDENGVSGHFFGVKEPFKPACPASLLGLLVCKCSDMLQLDWKDLSSPLPLGISLKCNVSWTVSLKGQDIHTNGCHAVIPCFKPFVGFASLVTRYLSCSTALIRLVKWQTFYVNSSRILSIVSVHP